MEQDLFERWAGWETFLRSYWTIFFPIQAETKICILVAVRKSQVIFFQQHICKWCHIFKIKREHQSRKKESYQVTIAICLRSRPSCVSQLFCSMNNLRWILTHLFLERRDDLFHRWQVLGLQLWEYEFSWRSSHFKSASWHSIWDHPKHNRSQDQEMWRDNNSWKNVE